jgi:hypothetical protein
MKMIQSPGSDGGGELATPSGISTVTCILEM